MEIKSFSATNDWFFVTTPQLIPGTAKPSPLIWPVAGWGLTINGDVIGMISVHGGGPDNKTTMGQTCRLVAPPPMHGSYKQFRELNEDERRLLLAHTHAEPPVEAPRSATQEAAPLAQAPEVAA